MPDMKGEDLFRELRTLDPGIPILLSSGYAEPGTLAGSLRGDRCWFIKKPYDRSSLLDLVRDILDGGRVEEGPPGTPEG